MLDLTGHYTRVIDAITECRIVPFLGANINLCGRLRSEKGELESWKLSNNPPSNRELAVFLNEISGNVYTKKFCCPLIDAEDAEHLPSGCPVRENVITKIALQHISQYILDLGDQGPDVLYGALRKLVDTKYLSNPTHKFFAHLPDLMRKKGYYPPYPLIVTTCFDRTLEQAFDEAGESYDLVSFIFDQTGGRFSHKPPGEDPRPIENPNEYQELSLKQRPVLLKLYGGIGDDFVITENHYIDYLSHRDIAELLPANLLNQLRRHYIWFLGYSPSYWNLRVILHRIWPEQMIRRSRQTWWAVQSYPEAIDQSVWWRYNGIPITPPSLDEYIADIDEHIRKLPARELRHLPPATKVLQPRDQIFISYSHKDKAWLEKLQIMLKPAIRAEKLALWDDTKITPGAKWREEIKAALDAAKVAVLLVSADFLASDFIAQEELPSLLEASEKKGLKIVWIYVNDCLYRHSAIADYQAAHDVSKPLEAMIESQQQAILKEIGEKIIAAGINYTVDTMS